MLLSTLNVGLYARNVHLDIDMVLLGELAFAPFSRLVIGTYDVGPWALWNMMIIILINAALLMVFFKELLLTLFDTTVAYTLGFSASGIYYSLMLVSCITIVSAFNVVGSIIVVSLILTPAASAFLLTKKIKPMILLTLANALFSTLLGYSFAYLADFSIAGSIASAAGIQFLIIFIFASERGLLAYFLYHQKQRTILFINILKTHQAQHCCNTIAQKAQHLGWTEAFIRKISHKVGN